jgi:hypothetical protein
LGEDVIGYAARLPGFAWSSNPARDRRLQERIAKTLLLQQSNGRVLRPKPDPRTRVEGAGYHKNLDAIGHPVRD